MVDFASSALSRICDAAVESWPNLLLNVVLTTGILGWIIRGVQNKVVDTVAGPDKTVDLTRIGTAIWDKQVDEYKSRTSNDVWRESRLVTIECALDLISGRWTKYGCNLPALSKIKQSMHQRGMRVALIPVCHWIAKHYEDRDIRNFNDAIDKFMDDRLEYERWQTEVSPQEQTRILTAQHLTKAMGQLPEYAIDDWL